MGYEGDRLGAACDFRIVELEGGGDSLCSSMYYLEWILEQRLPFDSTYYHESDRPVHSSYAPQERQSLWAFMDRRVLTKRSIQQ